MDSCTGMLEKLTYSFKDKMDQVRILQQTRICTSLGLCMKWLPSVWEKVFQQNMRPNFTKSERKALLDIFLETDSLDEPERMLSRKSSISPERWSKTQNGDQNLIHPFLKPFLKGTILRSGE